MPRYALDNQLIFHHALAIEGLTAERGYQRGIAVWMPVDAQQSAVKMRAEDSMLVYPKCVWRLQIVYVAAPFQQ